MAQRPDQAQEHPGWVVKYKSGEQRQQTTFKSRAKTQLRPWAFHVARQWGQAVWDILFTRHDVRVCLQSCSFRCKHCLWLSHCFLCFFLAAVEFKHKSFGLKKKNYSEWSWEEVLLVSLRWERRDHRVSRSRSPPPIDFKHSPGKISFLIQHLSKQLRRRGKFSKSCSLSPPLFLSTTLSFEQQHIQGETAATLSCFVLS